MQLFGSVSAAAEAPCAMLEDRRQCPEAASMESARGIALGTGARASSVSSSAVAYSPAALALGELYHLEGNVDYMAHLNTVALGAVAVDSATSDLGAGIAFRGFLSGDTGYSGFDGRIGLAYPFSEAFALGLSGRYIDLSHDLGEDMRSKVDGLTLDAGLRVVPTQGLQLDVAALNFLNLDSPYVPVTLTGSVAFSLAENFGVGADLLWDFTTFADPEMIVGGGLEYLAGESMPLRIGYRFDAGREDHSITAGVGYTDQQVGVDVSLRQQVNAPPDGESYRTRVMAGLRYHVN
ncbi:MAG: hypothetical protein OEZ06_23190 [Myxococcales bacterium]|nr:hypothetical protein [Myxococcales bacterium]